MKLCSHLRLVFRKLVTCLTYNPCPGGFRRASNSFRSYWSCPRCENTPENADGAENKYGDGEDNCPEHDSSNDELILKSRLKLDFHFAPRFGEFAPSQPHVGYLASRGRSLVLRQQRSASVPTNGRSLAPTTGTAFVSLKRGQLGTTVRFGLGASPYQATGAEEAPSSLAAPHIVFEGKMPIKHAASRLRL